MSVAGPLAREREGWQESEVKGREKKEEEEEKDRKRSRGRPVRTTDTLLPWRLPRRALLLVRKTT